LFLALSILPTDAKLGNLLLWAFGTMLLIAIIISFLKPNFLKPYWLRWLEDNYGHVLELMFEEARQMGGRNWEMQVKTQAELETWADSVAAKHGWQRLR
jgi:hypothetical protein